MPLSRVREIAAKLPPISLLLVVSLAGFLLTVTAVRTSETKLENAPQKHALIDRVLAERQHVDDLDKAVERVRAETLSARELQASQNAQSQQSLQEERATSMLAGTVAVKGSGIAVRLADAPRPSGEANTSFGASRIQDTDLQLVVNALVASGAEAIAINDNRISTVTPIRAAGGTIVVNYRPVSSPYRIIAIGANKDSFQRTEIALRLKSWRTSYELGYSVESGKRLEVPAYAGRGKLGFAQPLPTLPRE